MTEETREKPTEGKKKFKLNIWMTSTIVLIIILIGVLIVFGTGISGMTVTESDNTLKPEEAALKTIKFINENLVQPGTEASFVSVKEVDGMYNITISLQDNEIPVLLTINGNYLLLPNGGWIDIASFEEAKKQQQEQPPQEEQQASPISCDDIEKTDKPELNAFVVSYCPYGLQMQRVIIPVAEFFGDKAIINLRYIGSVSSDGKTITAMHGEKEATENLRQICIREEQSDKFWDYIACFIKKGEVDNCISEAKIDKTKLDTCMNTPSKGVEYAKVDFDLFNQINSQCVQLRGRNCGSPALSLNGYLISEFDFGGRTAEAVKTMICCSFKDEPAGCSQKLSTDQASTGFSETYSGGSATGNSGATC